MSGTLWRGWGWGIPLLMPAPRVEGTAVVRVAGAPQDTWAPFFTRFSSGTQRPSEAVINITPSSQVETEARTGAELASGGSDPDGLALTLTFDPLLAVKFLV